MPNDAEKPKKKRKGHKKRHRGEERVRNARGELVTVKEFALEQTLESTNKSLALYRERMEGLFVLFNTFSINTNEELQEMCTQQEQDALEVISALQTDAEKRENEIKDRENEITTVFQSALSEKEALKNTYERKLQEVNAILNEKEAAYKVMQSEFSVIKDFRKKRHELLKDLESQKQELIDTERRHKEIVIKMEKKFFEEKIRLQKDANRKISELATKAHKEAVANLKETTKEVYKENIRMVEALAYHVQEGEELKKENARLSSQNKSLLEAKDLHDVIIKEKILQHKQQSQEIADLHAKIESMEHSLSHVVREFEHERDLVGAQAKKELSECKKTMEKLSKNLVKKTAEMKHIRRLAQHILDQRTEVEKFFMQSLDDIRRSIIKEKQLKRKQDKESYNVQLRAAFKAGQAFPAIQSFRKSLTTAPDATKADSEPSAFGNNEAEKPMDISELSWHDKERVLRLLFAKMNGVSYTPVKEEQAPEFVMESGSELEEESEVGDHSRYGSTGNFEMSPATSNISIAINMA